LGVTMTAAAGRCGAGKVERGARESAALGAASASHSRKEVEAFLALTWGRESDLALCIEIALAKSS
jgi:hypothetical protein